MGATGITAVTAVSAVFLMDKSDTPHLRIDATTQTMQHISLEDRAGAETRTDAGS